MKDRDQQINTREVMSSPFEAARSMAINPPPDSICSPWEEQRRRACYGKVLTRDDVSAIRAMGRPSAPEEIDHS